MGGWRGVAVVALLGAGCGRGPFFRFPDQLVERCSAVDFLFVIDNSESMARHQDNLRANFEPFIDGIGESLDDVEDFHVGVVTTDAYRDNGEGCRELGALVTSVDAPGVQRRECGPFAEGERYMTDEDDLTEAFNCAADVGTDGSRSEEPMKAMSRAINGTSWPWYRQCNGGFLRDDALLVSVIITDEADGEQTDNGTIQPGPEDWFDTVVSAKGTESNAVVVSLLNGVTPECPVSDEAFDGTKIAEFTRSFTHGFVGGICQPDYGAVFARAVDEIDEACTTYTAELAIAP
ncbi:MAG: hypothetical protein AAF721_02295 [Myxococcota bacterium]